MNDPIKNYNNIPDELKKEKRWCLYKMIQRDGKNGSMSNNVGDNLNQ